MKTIPYTINKASILPVLGIFTSIFLLFSQSASAQSHYTTNVKILEYYGSQGSDYDGHPIYGVKVHQGDSFYFVELHEPMPCLKSHRNEWAQVTIDRQQNCWGKVYFDGHTATVHKVTKVRNDFDYSNQASRDRHSDHDHRRILEKTPFSLFSWK